MMKHTLREISDAVWAVRGGDDAECQRIYDRARMLRDRGLIASSTERQQGRTMMFSDADVAAAVIALTASLNGQPWGIIEAINADLRAIGNTTGAPRYEQCIEKIKGGVPHFVRLDIISEPWGYTKARLGTADVCDFYVAEPKEGTTQILIWPVTGLAKPVLDYLSAAHPQV